MTLFHKIFEYAETNSNDCAIMDSSRQFSYKELSLILQENYHSLIEQGVESGDLVGLRFTEPLKFAIAFLSYGLRGCSVVPLAGDFQEEEIQYISNKINISQIVTETTCGLSFDIPQKLRGENLIEICIPDASREILYHLTSGSTGEKKVCKRTLDAVTSEAKDFIETLSISRTDKILSAPPIWHSFSFGAALCTALVCGAALILTDRFSPRTVVRMTEQNKVTILILVPTMARLIAKVPFKEEFINDKMRYILLGTGNVDKETAAIMEAYFKCEIAMNYGSTETGGIITRAKSEPFETIGKPMRNNKIKIKNSLGIPVVNGDIGQLWVKSQSMMVNYLDGAAEFDEDGYFFTGDLACQDMNKNIYIKGREKRIIKIGGKTINPVEIEAHLKKHTQIEDCYVQLRPSKHREVLEAFVVLNGSSTEAELISYCRDTLGSDRSPSKIHICRQLPRNSIGKIDLKQLNEQTADNFEVM